MAFIAKNLQFEGRILSRDKSSDRIGSLVVVAYLHTTIFNVFLLASFIVTRDE